MKIVSLFIFLASCSSMNLNSKLIRLDKLKNESLDLNRIIVALLITENCSLCQSQLAILQKCVVKDRVAIFIEGDDEEKLRRVIKKKKINFPSYKLNPATKNIFSFDETTPTLSVKSGGVFKTHKGVLSCEETIKLIKSRP